MDGKHFAGNKFTEYFIELDFDFAGNDSVLS